jgi:hypothetical protein
VAFGPFTLHGNRSWRIGGDHVRLEAVARDGFVDEGGDPREGNLALVVIERGNGETVRQWIRAGDPFVLGGEEWTLTRIGDRGRIAEWSGHEPAVPARQPGRFAVFTPGRPRP